MAADKCLPITVGVTGHRMIREESIPAVYAAVKAELLNIQKLCPNSPLVMLNALAEGGDLLCADAAEELGIPLQAVLPMEREIYERDFSVKALERFSHHCVIAEKVFIPAFTESIPENGISRDFQYRQAGIYIATHCQILLALWDGGSGTAAACGTAETVDFALNRRCSSESEVLYPLDRTAVIHVMTPRKLTTKESTTDVATHVAGSVRILGDWDAVKEWVRNTDCYNHWVISERTEEKILVPNAFGEQKTNRKKRCEVFLDYSGTLIIVFKFRQNGVVFGFDCSCPPRYDRLSHRIIENLKSISLVTDADETGARHFLIRDTVFADINCSTGEVWVVNKLTSFELRLLAQGRESAVPFPRDATDFRPRTDLHTHFTGAFTPDQLVAIGIKHNLYYPADYLARVGVDIGKYRADENGCLKMTSINSRDLGMLKMGLMISPFTLETFNKMEEIYLLRAPVTKHKGLFSDLLYLLADTYRETGVEYAELSFSLFIRDPEYMKLINDTIPRIEAETGVKLRFIASLWRHSVKEWNMDDTDRIISIARSPYIVGADFMGHETNATETFEEELRLLADYAMKEDPCFAIRVHAGETPMMRLNVKNALKIVFEEHAARELADGCKYAMPRVRIGHGLYGIDDETIRLAREMEAVIEFNISSNLALNNVNSITEIPIKKYMDSGVNVVLGTDGGGLFSTVGEQEALLAAAAGLDPDDFQKLRETEAWILTDKSERERTHPRSDDIRRMYKEIRYSSSNGRPRYNHVVAERNAARKAKTAKMLELQLKRIGIITEEKTIQKDTDGKTPIIITGSSEKTWPEIKPEDRDYIKLTMQALVDALNPDTAYLVTGGTNYGVEKTVHRAVHRRNSMSRQSPLVCLGTLTMEAADNNCKGIEPDTITHAVILEHDGKKAENWIDLPETQLEYAKERNGYMIGIGGGIIVSDMIQRGYNLDVKMHLMDGPNGASTNKSRSLFGKNYSFKTAEELLLRLFKQNPGLLEAGFDPQKLDDRLEYAKQEMKNIT